MPTTSPIIETAQTTLIGSLLFQSTLLTVLYFIYRHMVGYSLIFNEIKPALASERASANKIAIRPTPANIAALRIPTAPAQIVAIFRPSRKLFLQKHPNHLGVERLSIN